jgi:type I restriction enzyme S subunit
MKNTNSTAFTTNMRRYDIMWADSIPASWSVKLLKYVVDNINEIQNCTDISDDYIPLDQIESWTGKRIIPEEPPQPESNVKRFCTHDVLFCKLRPYLAKVLLAKRSGVCTSELLVLRSQGEVTPEYLAYVMRAKPMIDYIDSSTFGAKMPRANWTFIGNIPFAVPPQAEQDAIVAFLDEKLADIDRYIAAKQRLIELLDEQKAAIINQAVTRGLDPAVEMKESGVEWLGEIPVHWKMIKLSRVANVLNGTTPSRNQPDYWQQGAIPWLSSGKVNDYFVETPTEYITEKALCECSLSIIPTGSIIMGMIGQGKTRGMTAYLGIETCINQNLAAIVPNGELNGRFLHHFLTFAYKPLRDYGRGGNQEALNCEIISSFRVPLPPNNEQNKIAVYLDSTTKELSDAKGRIEREIELMQELRTTLIAEAVTGKIDVRKQG